MHGYFAARPAYTAPPIRPRGRGLLMLQAESNLGSSPREEYLVHGASLESEFEAKVNAV